MTDDILLGLILGTIGRRILCTSDGTALGIELGTSDGRLLGISPGN